MRGFFEQEKVNELYPNAIMIQPMGIWQIPNNKKSMTEDILLEKQGDYFAELKKDGNWYAISVTEDNVYLFARTISKKTGLLVEKSQNVPHITETFKRLPAGTYIEGEIYYPNGNSDLVGTIMRCNAEKAVRRQSGLDEKYNLEIGNTDKNECKIHFYIHNVLYFNNENLTCATNIERYFKLVEIYNAYLADNKYIDLAEVFLPSDYNFFKLAEKCISEGEEGLVLKKIDGVYYPDQKKAWETIKLKREDSLDVICIGFEEPTMLYEGENIETWDFWVRQEDEMRVQGKYFNQQGYLPVTKNYYYNWIGAIKIGAYDENGSVVDLGTVSSGLTDELKESIKKNPNEYLMKPILLECMEVYHGTSIRSPRLIKFRDDINIKECTISKLI